VFLRSSIVPSIEAQTLQVFRNLTTVLEASGSSVDHIVKATVFLADMNDYNVMNELYKKQFKGDPPARTTVQVARLPRDARIEIEAVAVLK
jgi:2-iminobutanoate/2-iminopropanoate deaminase